MIQAKYLDYILAILNNEEVKTDLLDLKGYDKDYKRINIAQVIINKECSFIVIEVRQGLTLNEAFEAYLLENKIMKHISQCELLENCLVA